MVTDFGLNDFDRTGRVAFGHRKRQWEQVVVPRPYQVTSPWQYHGEHGKVVYCEDGAAAILIGGKSPVVGAAWAEREFGVDVWVNGELSRCVTDAETQIVLSLAEGNFIELRSGTWYEVRSIGEPTVLRETYFPEPGVKQCDVSDFYFRDSNVVHLPDFDSDDPDLVVERDAHGFVFITGSPRL